MGKVIEKKITLNLLAEGNQCGAAEDYCDFEEIDGNKGVCFLFFEALEFANDNDDRLLRCAECVEKHGE